MRRIRRIVLASLMLALAVAAGFTAGTTVAQQKQDRSPHADALDLILRTQADEIRKAEAPFRLGETGDEIWWFDTKERTWVVKRPVAPGVLDSTHLFDVRYQIDGKDVANWLVDTRKGTATRGETRRRKEP